MHEAAILAELIESNQPCVALTGAGVSTESGIPDFRSAGGIWERFNPYEVASIDAFDRDPARVWEFYALRLDVLADARPNAAHHALAELERAGLVRAVVTQNVDRLHAAAGSRDVIEVHGTIARARCLRCETVVEGEALRAFLPLPQCPAAGRCPSPTWSCSASSCRSTRSSARPCSRGTRRCCSWWDRRSRYGRSPGFPRRRAGGGKIAIVNRGPTAYDARAALVLNAAAGDTLAACAEALR